MSRQQVVFEKVYSSHAVFLDGRSAEEWLEVAKAISLIRRVLPEKCDDLEVMIITHLVSKLKVTLDKGKSFTLNAVPKGMSADGARMHMSGWMSGMTNVRAVFGRRAVRARDDYDTEFVVSLFVHDVVHGCEVAFLVDPDEEVGDVLANRRGELAGWPTY